MGEGDTDAEKVIERFRQDTKDDLGELRADVRDRVTRELHNAHRDADKAELSKLRTEFDAYKKAQEQKEADAAKQRTADRRLIFTAVAAPVALLIVNVYLKSKGLA